jgi:hypothetical protein
MRDQVEEETNRIFFAPWACLNSTDIAQLHDVLTLLKNSLQEMTESDADTT